MVLGAQYNSILFVVLAGIVSVFTPSIVAWKYGGKTTMLNSHIVESFRDYFAWMLFSYSAIQLVLFALGTYFGMVINVIAMVFTFVMRKKTCAKLEAAEQAAKQAFKKAAEAAEVG